MQPKRKRGRPPGSTRPRPAILVNPAHVPPAPTLGSWDDGAPVEATRPTFSYVRYDPFTLGPRYPEGYGEPPRWRVAGRVGRRSAWDCLVRIGQAPRQRWCRLEWVGITCLSITWTNSPAGALVIYSHGTGFCPEHGDLARAAFTRAQHLHLTPRRPRRWNQRFYRTRPAERSEKDNL